MPITESTVTRQINSLDNPTTAITFLTGPGPETIKLTEFLQEARACASELQARGVGPGDRVALLSPTTHELATAITATWLAGATLIVLPLPMRLGSIESFVEATANRIRAADLKLLAISSDFTGYLEPEPGDPQPLALPELMGGSASQYAEPDVSPDEMVVLQFTSGSTGDPKGVTVTHRAMIANLIGAHQAAQITHADKFMSWLPLYHDMGLIGLFGTSLLFPVDLVLGAPQDFLARPRDWLRAMSDYKVTGCAAPNSAYALAARMLERSPGEFDLSHWRLALNGAEPVDPDTVDTFVKAGESCGLSPMAPFPAYGLAEATIAGTFPEPGTGMRAHSVDRRALEEEGKALPGDDMRLAILGRPVPSVEIRVVDDMGNAVADCTVGEVQLRGPAITTGYFRDPIATADAFDGEWFKTGDLGYLIDGELVICGRIKDVIIVSGRNCYPQDIEHAAERIEGVRPGNVVAFGIPKARGRESLVVVAETKSPQDAPDIARKVATHVREWSGIPVKDVVMIVPGTLPKTSSGKVQRRLCKAQYTAGELKAITSLADEIAS